MSQDDYAAGKQGNPNQSTNTQGHHDYHRGQREAQEEYRRKVDGILLSGRQSQDFSSSASKASAFSAIDSPGSAVKSCALLGAAGACLYLYSIAPGSPLTQYAAYAGGGAIAGALLSYLVMVVFKVLEATLVVLGYLVAFAFIVFVLVQVFA